MRSAPKPAGSKWQKPDCSRPEYAAAISEQGDSIEPLKKTERSGEFM